MISIRRRLVGVVGLMVLVATGCASTEFVSTWKSPTAKKLDVKGARVAAVVMIDDISRRRKAEETLAREISSHGAQGIPMYEIIPQSTLGNEVGNEGAARSALEAANVQGLVVMRPVATNTTLYINSGDPGYSLYWGGYYDYGWGDPWNAGAVDANTTVSVDTRIYSLKQNQLVWAGQSKTTNPTSVDGLVADVAKASAKKLKEIGLVAQR